MKKIPRPTRKKNIPDDPSDRYLQKWKELFNTIDSANIQAFIKGDQGFPQSNYSMELHQARLEDACNTNVQLFIRISGYLFWKYGGEIYCCLQNESFASSWIEEFDENMDTVHTILSWEDMYLQLVEDTILHRKRIPFPCPAIPTL